MKKYSIEVSAGNKLQVRKKTKVKNKSLKHSSRVWLQKHINDEFVHKAKEEGYSSRAAYKLIEIAKKNKLFSDKNQTVLDLGAAPGSWSEAILMHFKVNSIIAVDLLELKIKDERLKFIQGDFTTQEIQNEIIKSYNGRKLKIIISDIAPNTSGDRDRDRLRGSAILYDVLNFAIKYLDKDGVLLMKCIMGAEQEILKLLKENFVNLQYIKPNASRKISSEIFLLCKKKDA